MPAIVSVFLSDIEHNILKICFFSRIINKRLTLQAVASGWALVLTDWTKHYKMVEH